jgi:hypothetical protein
MDHEYLRGVIIQALGAFEIVAEEDATFYRTTVSDAIESLELALDMINRDINND